MGQRVHFQEGLLNTCVSIYSDIQLTRMHFLLKAASTAGKKTEEVLAHVVGAGLYIGRDFQAVRAKYKPAPTNAGRVWEDHGGKAASTVVEIFTCGS